MKKIKFLLMLLLGVVMSFAFVSCGDDDDDDNNGQSASSSIVGTWNLTYNDGKNDISKTYTFKADGTFTYIYDDEWNISTQLGTYQYDKDSNILILVVTNATNERRIGTKTYKIELVANSYFIIDYDKYYKQ